MKNDVIKLITVTTEQDADGFPITTEETKMCFADVQSAKGVEFYSAYNVGLKISLVAVISIFDYKEATDGKVKPTLVEFEECRYRIVRTYKVRENDDIELTLTEVE